MSRMCEDCGIASWQDCQCDPRAGMDHPDPRNFRLPDRPDENDPIAEDLVESFVAARDAAALGLDVEDRPF